MAYEYESRLKDYLIGHKNVNPKFDGFEILKSLDELKEVYRKGKAFDEILKIDNQATDEDRITGEYESVIETVISEYMEDE